MTAYNVVNPGSLVAGQPEDISQVLANFQALATILNGNIDGANLKNYPTDITKILRGDMSWAQLVAVTAPNVASANTDLAAPTAYISIMNPSAGGGTVRSIATPLAGTGCRLLFQNWQTAITLKHQLAGGTGVKLFMASQADRVLGFGDSVDFYYDGTSWTEGNHTFATLPRVTTSAIAGGPPANPQDGDIWYATAVDAAGTRWAFQYNAGSASTYKWEFIGGAPSRASVTGQVATASGSFVDLGGPSITAPRSGEYTVEFRADAWSSISGGGAVMNISPGLPTDGALGLGYFDVPGNGISIGAFATVTATAGQAIAIYYAQSTGGTASFQQRTILVTPRRVS